MTISGVSSSNPFSNIDPTDPMAVKNAIENAQLAGLNAMIDPSSSDDSSDSTSSMGSTATTSTAASETADEADQINQTDSETKLEIQEAAIKADSNKAAMRNFTNYMTNLH